MPKAGHDPTLPDDPIHLAIARHRDAARIWQAAVAVRSAYPDSANPLMLDEQQRQLDHAVANARLVLIDCGLNLIECGPTTIGGFVAALEYARDQLLEGGAAMPQAGDWLEAMVDTLADAAADLLAKTTEVTPKGENQ
jgi:hypothetical protein